MERLKNYILGRVGHDEERGCTNMSSPKQQTKVQDASQEDGGKPNMIPYPFWEQQPIDSFSLGSDSDQLYTSSWRYPGRCGVWTSNCQTIH